jgi:hypothetical protein
VESIIGSHNSGQDAIFGYPECLGKEWRHAGGLAPVHGGVSLSANVQERLLAERSPRISHRDQ